MSAFDRVIGYEKIKNELIQICDMIHNKEKYEKMGAKLPKGLLLDGEPGLGKTLMVKCFIEEAGLTTYTIRRDKGDEFTESITKTFEEAKENAPSIVFLDDMDKFANEDDRHRDAEEYVAVQSGIDSVKDYDVFVIGTVNNSWKLPGSLTRAGRFDRYIRVCKPSGKDSADIIRYYLSNKKLDDTVNFDDLTRMIQYSSCAELETLMNEAAIYAVNKDKDAIGMDELVTAILKAQYNSSDDYTALSDELMNDIAFHEAGHLVASEILQPGSVGFASICPNGGSERGGFIHRCVNYVDKNHAIYVSLAGRAATELFTDGDFFGSGSDVQRAFDQVHKYIADEGMSGLGLYVYNDRWMSENERENTEMAVNSEVSKYYSLVLKLLSDNRRFVEEAAKALLKKKILFYSDIQEIRKACLEEKKTA